MKEEFILKLFEKFEKGDAVVLQIKQDDCELILKKEGAFPKSDSAAAALPPVMYAAPPAFMPPGGFAGYPAGAPVCGSVGTPAQAVSSVSADSAAVQNAPAASAGNTASAQGTPASGGQAAADKNLVFIKSPIVGTFYRSPSPDSPPYVEKGAAVKKGQPLCVLEAMKMMNTLECEYDGVIEDILASNGDLVEFDQNIFAIRVK
ncbi:MAG: acetyl-CoA carboxylase biotin carboxyl carrier protein [Treponema sp.]|uniref:acetyl-CoA carboxylase biotin carboxyl carrier protein n=1 Tax=Treponema sp. TaxID=166 RepID=UPI003FA22ACF